MLRIAGVDEVGRGPLVGPVVVAAVILDPTRPIVGLKDSKKLSEKRRDALNIDIQEKALCYRIEMLSAEVIDDINILQATLQGMRNAVLNLSIQPDKVLVDGNQVPNLRLPTEAIVRGDATIPEIQAASILAKVFRDQWMRELDQRYPLYGFAQNKGYPTAAHRAALRLYGPCPYHRKSFAPVREALLS